MSYLQICHCNHNVVTTPSSAISVGYNLQLHCAINVYQDYSYLSTEGFFKLEKLNVVKCAQNLSALFCKRLKFAEKF